MFVVAGQDLRPGLAIFRQHWGVEHPPLAISAAMVASLANPDFLVEIEAIAITGSGIARAAI